MVEFESRRPVLSVPKVHHSSQFLRGTSLQPCDRQIDDPHADFVGGDLYRPSIQGDLHDLEARSGTLNHDDNAVTVRTHLFVHPAYPSRGSLDADGSAWEDPPRLSTEGVVSPKRRRVAYFSDRPSSLAVLERGVGRHAQRPAGLEVRFGEVREPAESRACRDRWSVPSPGGVLNNCIVARLKSVRQTRTSSESRCSPAKAIPDGTLVGTVARVNEKTVKFPPVRFLGRSSDLLCEVHVRHPRTERRPARATEPLPFPGNPPRAKKEATTASPIPRAKRDPVLSQ